MMLAGWAIAIGLALAAFRDAARHFPTRRVGGLTFWRVGRFGGSFYVSRGGE